MMIKKNVVGGVLFFYGHNVRGLTLQTHDFMATFNLADMGSFSIPSGHHSAGDIVGISGKLAGDQTLRFGPAYFDGTNYPNLWYEGSLEFQATPVITPADSSKSIAVCSHLIFDGSLKAYLSNNISGGGGPALFNLQLTGEGTATAYFGASSSDGSAQFRGILARSYSLDCPTELQGERLKLRLS